MMKQILFLLFSVTLFIPGFGQDPGKDLKQASRSLNKYRLDPEKNADELAEARKLINSVIESPEMANDAEAWVTYGEVTTEVVNKDVQAHVLDNNFQFTNTEAYQAVLPAFFKGHELAEKNYREKDAIKGVETIMNNVAYVAYYLLIRGKSEEAFPIYQSVLQADDFLEKTGGENPFPSENEMNDQHYYAAVAALQAGDYGEAEKLFDFLIGKDYDNAAIYEGMFTVLSERGEIEEANRILEIGREKYPDDGQLVTAKINYTLRPGITELDHETLVILLEDLDAALELQPSNASIPAIKGTIYAEMLRENLSVEDTLAAEGFDHASLKTAEDGGCYMTTPDGTEVYVDERYCNDPGSVEASSNPNMEMAVENFMKALEIDAQYQDAMYGMGELHYQLAAHYANQANALADDYSKEGTAKWEAKKTQMLDQFKLARPHFQSAFSNDPSDVNALIALREIAVRLDNLEVANEYKAMLDGYSAGQQYQCDDTKSYTGTDNGGCYYELSEGNRVFVPNSCCQE